MPLPSCQTTQVCSGFAVSSVACLPVVAAVSIVVFCAGLFAGFAACLPAVAAASTVLSFAGLLAGFTSGRLVAFGSAQFGGLLAAPLRRLCGRFPCRFLRYSFLHHRPLFLTLNGPYLPFRVATGCTIITPRIAGTDHKATRKPPFRDKCSGYAEESDRWGRSWRRRTGQKITSVRSETILFAGNSDFQVRQVQRMQFLHNLVVKGRLDMNGDDLCRAG